MSWPLTFCLRTSRRTLQRRNRASMSCSVMECQECLKYVFAKIWVWTPSPLEDVRVVSALKLPVTFIFRDETNFMFSFVSAIWMGLFYGHFVSRNSLLFASKWWFIWCLPFWNFCFWEDERYFGRQLVFKPNWFLSVWTCTVPVHMGEWQLK